MAGETAGIGASGAGMLMGTPMTAWLAAGSTVLGAALSPSPAAPAVSSASAYTNVDHSGWNVSTGGGNSSSVGAFPWYVWAALAAGAILYMKHRNK